jgi:hypothetical protein
LREEVRKRGKTGGGSWCEKGGGEGELVRAVRVGARGSDTGGRRRESR